MAEPCPVRRVPYRDRSGGSGVLSYALGDDYIQIWFTSGAGYRYDETATGKRHVATMKRLALRGEGLATYISQNVGKNYACKL